MKLPNLVIFRTYPGACMGYDLSKQAWVMGYGLWLQNPCIPTQEMEKAMGFEGVWVIQGIGYKGVDCSYGKGFWSHCI